MGLVYEEPLLRRYYAGSASLAGIAKLVLLLVTLVLPYYLAAITGVAFEKEMTFSEQPLVRAKNRFIVMAETAVPGAELVWTSYSDVNRHLGENARAPVITVLPEDGDNDGRPESLRIGVEFPLDVETEAVQRFRMIYFLDYQLRDTSRIWMESAVYVDSSTPTPSSSLFVVGDLKMRQVGPLPAPNSDVRGVYNDSIVSDSASSLSDVRFESVLETLFARNESTFISEPVAVWAAGAGDHFKADVLLRIPPQTFRCRTTSWYMLKWLLVQYIAFFYVIRFLVGRVERILYRGGSLETRVLLDASVKAHLA